MPLEIKEMRPADQSKGAPKETEQRIADIGLVVIFLLMFAAMLLSDVMIP